jgi:hypothetical protein
MVGFALGSMAMVCIKWRTGVGVFLEAWHAYRVGQYALGGVYSSGSIIAVRRSRGWLVIMLGQIDTLILLLGV